MSVFFFAVLFVITLVCLVPFGVSCFYIVLGIKSYRTGKKENSRAKMTGGMNSVVLSLAGLAGSYFLWRWLCAIFLPREL